MTWLHRKIVRETQRYEPSKKMNDKSTNFCKETKLITNVVTINGLDFFTFGSTSKTDYKIQILVM